MFGYAVDWIGPAPPVIPKCPSRRFSQGKHLDHRAWGSSRGNSQVTEKLTPPQLQVAGFFILSLSLSLSQDYSVQPHCAGKINYIFFKIYTEKLLVELLAITAFWKKDIMGFE